jgi:hypothetical protein
MQTFHVHQGQTNQGITLNARAGQRGRDPLDDTHPYESMCRYAELLALRHDSARTRHRYYRAMGLVHQYFGVDPATLGEDHGRDYILCVKTRKAWKPKTIRQTVACARLFLVEMLEDLRRSGAIKSGGERPSTRGFGRRSRP